MHVWKECILFALSVAFFMFFQTPIDVRFSLKLAPHVGLEPTTPCNNPTDSATLRQMGRPSGCYLLSIGGLCSDSREGIKKKGAAVGRTLLFGSSLYAHVEPRLVIHGFFSDGRCCFNYVCAAIFVANSSLTIRPRDFRDPNRPCPPYAIFTRES